MGESGVFEYRSVSFGTPPKDGPPDPTGVRVTGNPIRGFKFQLDRNLLRLSSELGFNDVTIQTEGRMAGLPEAIRRWADETGNLQAILDLGMTISLWVREFQDHEPGIGEISVENQELWSAVRRRYRRLLTHTLPEVDYLVLTVVESEINVSDDPEILGKLVTSINDECRAADKTLIFRTCVWFPEEMEVMERAIAMIPDDVIVMSKCVPQDWHLRGVDNPIIGRVGKLRQYIEFDIAGEYNKLTNLACAYTGILESRIDFIEGKGCTGVAVRVDRYGSTVYGQAQEANLWFLGLRTSGAVLDADEAWKRYTETVFGKQAAPAMEAALRPTGEVVAEAISVDRESYGYSRDYRPAGRNMENPFDVHHSPAKWDPDLLPIYERIIRGDPAVIRAKTRAYEKARESAILSRTAIDNVAFELPAGAYVFFSWKLEENIFHLDMFCNMELAWLKAAYVRHGEGDTEASRMATEIEGHLSLLRRVYADRLGKNLHVHWRGAIHHHIPGSYHDWGSWMSGFCRFAGLEPWFLPGARILEPFDEGWRFHTGDVPEGYGAEIDDSEWAPVALPHDWSIGGPYDESRVGGERNAFLPTGIGWYRKRFEAPAARRGRRVLIQFDGVYRNSTVWINGHRLGRRPYGFVGFTYDLTPHIREEGANLVAVRVDNEEQPSCRWYTGTGINRHVRLIDAASLRVDTWGTAVTASDITGEQCLVRVVTTIRNDERETRFGDMLTVVEDPDGREVGRASTGLEVTGEGWSEVAQEIIVPNPLLWDPDRPRLYSAGSYVVEGGVCIDEYRTTFGIRDVSFDSDRGLVLNGRGIKLKGVCLHDDAGNLGTAVPVEVWERRLKTLKSMGCNAIRGSHNPKAPEFLDVCDRLGILVIDEAFDKWLVGPGGYKDDFFGWWRIDLVDFVKRDRNHPSVIVWSVGNEVYEQDKPYGPQLLSTMVETVKAHDPSRPVTCGLRPMLGEQRVRAIGSFASQTDIVSLNYQEPWYREDRKRFPGRLIVGSESYSYYRGTTEHFKAFEERNPWFDVEDNDFVLGQFLWAGIDYLGETPGWPCKGWTSAPIDRCGFRKPRSYYHESVWADEPMVHIAVFDDGAPRPPEKEHWDWPNIVSHWCFSGKESLRVVTYTNCAEVELEVNDRSLGVQRLADWENRMMVWDVPYERGTIRAVGIDGNDRVCEFSLTTAGEPYAVVFAPDRGSVPAEGGVANVEAAIVDQNGIRCPFAGNRLSFLIDGPAALLCLDSGDMMSDEVFDGPETNAHNGRALAVVRATGTGGTVQITGTSSSLVDGICAIEAVPYWRREPYLVR